MDPYIGRNVITTEPLAYLNVHGDFATLPRGEEAVVVDHDVDGTYVLWSEAYGAELHVVTPDQFELEDN